MFAVAHSKMEIRYQQLLYLWVFCSSVLLTFPSFLNQIMNLDSRDVTLNQVEMSFFPPNIAVFVIYVNLVEKCAIVQFDCFTKRQQLHTCDHCLYFSKCV